MRSISSIISTLRTSFRDTDFTEAESELKSMEQNLRSVTLQNRRLEEENRRLKREFEVSDGKVSELGREVGVLKERVKKGVERYERLMEEVRVSEGEKERISMELRDRNEEIRVLRGAVGSGDVVDEKIRVLEREKSELEVELDRLRRENEDEIKGLRRELCEKCEEICDLKGVERRNEGEIKVLEGELERVKRKVTVLEMEKRDLEVKFDELSRENERVVGDGKEKNRRILELKTKVEGLEMEMSGIMKEKEIVTKKYVEEVEERLLNLEVDVGNWLLENVPIVKKVMGAQVEKVLSGVLNGLDSEQVGWANPVEDIVVGDSVASQWNEAETNLASSFDTEVGRMNGTVSIKRDASLDVVVLSDSDCDNEDCNPLSKFKRKQVLSQCSNHRLGAYKLIATCRKSRCGKSGSSKGGCTD